MSAFIVKRFRVFRAPLHHYIGIIVTLVAFFPYIDIVLHMIAAIFLLLDAASTNAKEVYDS
ncbi:hypothetical protein AAHB54_20335 [Bacillus cereus]